MPGLYFEHFSQGSSIMTNATFSMCLGCSNGDGVTTCLETGVFFQRNTCLANTPSCPSPGILHDVHNSTHKPTMPHARAGSVLEGELLKQGFSSLNSTDVICCSPKCGICQKLFYPTLQIFPHQNQWLCVCEHTCVYTCVRVLGACFTVEK